jgi:hypothetical protein
MQIYRLGRAMNHHCISKSHMHTPVFHYNKCKVKQYAVAVRYLEVLIKLHLKVVHLARILFHKLKKNKNPFSKKL